MKRRLFLLPLLCLLLSVLLLSAGAAETVDSGTLENITWTLDADGLLTLSGTGDMPLCAMEAQVPWLVHKEAIKAAVIAPGITSVGPCAFRGCTQLQTVEIPDGVSSIVREAFYRCRSLSAVTLPDSVTTVGSQAFYSCDGLQTLELGGVTEIGYMAFNMCRGLTDITFPASLTAIGSAAFGSCDGLETVTFLGDAPDISPLAFSGAGILRFEDVICRYPGDNDTWTEDVRKSYGGRLKWVSDGEAEEEQEGSCGNGPLWRLSLDGTLTISGCGAVEEEPAFGLLRTRIKALVIEEGITAIPAGCFRDYENLSRVSLPSTLTAIPAYAFENTAIVSLEIPEGVTNVDMWAFGGCTALEEVRLPSTLEHLGFFVFSGCTSLSRVDLSACGTDLASYGLFSDCDSLTDLDFYTFDVIAQSMFLGCDGLGEVTVPEGVTMIQSDAFAGCTGMTRISFPTTLEAILPHAFSGCTALEEIVFTGDAPAADGINPPFGGTGGQEEAGAVTAIARYPADNPTWTEEAMAAMGGNLTWVPVCPGHVYDQAVIAPDCTRPGCTVFTCTLCGHSYEESPAQPLGHTYEDGICIRCGEKLPGDVNGDGIADSADAVCLLLHTLFPDRYVLTGSGDLDGNGCVDAADARVLLWQVLFPQA